MQRPDPHAARTAPWRRTLIVVGAAWALLATAAAATGGAPDLAWSAVAPGLAVATIVAARHRAAARAAVWASAAYLAVLAVGTVVAGLTGTGLDEADRVEGFARDANVLGAALAVAAAGWAAAAPARRCAAWAVALGWPLAATAVLYTGSRAAAGACLLAAATWLVLRVGRGRRAWAWGPPALAVVVALAALVWQRGVVEASPNLLAAPSDFAHREWRHDLAASVDVANAADVGPFPGTRAQRIRARATSEGPVLVFQTIGRSEPGVAYVASIYLRADAPQRVVLSNHLSEVACDVGPAWARCVTPPGIGDGVLQAQFHLMATEPGGAVDVLVFGAQYEVGREATAYAERRFAWLPQTLVRRIDVRRLDLWPADRRAIWSAAVDLARASPWTGIGATAAAEALSERTFDGIAQAHNGLLHLWLVRGALGVAAAVLLGFAVASALPHGAGRLLAPVFVALVATNVWDVTASEPVVIAPALLAVVAVGAARSRRAELAGPTDADGAVGP